MSDKRSLGTEEDRKMRLLEVLRSRPDDDACRACLEQLDDYIAVQQRGDDYLNRFPVVAGHLDGCLECAAAYGRLYELALAEATGRLPQPQTIPAPDLDFLRPSPATRLRQQLHDALQRAGETVRLQLSAALLAALRPSPAAALTRAPADSRRYSEQLLQLDPAQLPDSDLPLAMAAYRDNQQPDTCLIEVTAAPPGKSWPEVEGYRVTITTPTAVHRLDTDAWGLAAFTGILINELPQLIVEIRPPAA